MHSEGGSVKLTLDPLVGHTGHQYLAWLGK
jgi:hypothetical protein